MRHIGFFVRDINFMGAIFNKLGFSLIYHEVESVNGIDSIIEKYEYSDNLVIELIENNNIGLDQYHICFNGPVPYFLRNFDIRIGVPFDKNIKLSFVYVGDSIYFEFVESKNEL